MTRYKYCEICKKEVENPVRKPLETFEKTIWIIVSIATVGIAAIIFAIYYSNRKKKYCPTCFAEIKYRSEPIVKETPSKPLTPKEKILQKAGIEKEVTETEEPVEEEETEEEKDTTFCPYCGEDIKEGIPKCPYCHSKLKASYETR